MDYYGKYGKRPPTSKAAGDGGIKVDTKGVERKFAALLKAVGSEENQLKIHKKVARVVKKAQRNEITDYDRTIKVRRNGSQGGKTGPDIDIEPGTLKRSVSTWRIKGYKSDGNRETSYWVGPRATGRKDRKDGWFAGIVESGLQYFGPGPNKGAFERAKVTANAKALRMLEKEYNRVINQAAKK